MSPGAGDMRYLRSRCRGYTPSPADCCSTSGGRAESSPQLSTSQQSAQQPQRRPARASPRSWIFMPPLPHWMSVTVRFSSLSDGNS